MRAHWHNALFTFARILDHHHDSLSVWKSLNFVEQNCQLFSREAFSYRIENRQHRDALEQNHTTITRKEIEEDRAKLGKLTYTTERLNDLRDNALAHNDREFILKHEITHQKFSFQFKELYNVIDVLFQILNRYSYAFDASTYTKAFSGEDEVESVMKFIRQYLELRKREREEFKIHARSGRKRRTPNAKP